MMRDNLYILQQKCAPLFMMNDQLSDFYKKNRKQDAVEQALKNTELPTVHVCTTDLLMPYADHVDNMNNLSRRVKKTALLHQNSETHTLKLSQLLARLNNQHSIIDANYQDIEVASSFADTCQLMVLNSLTSHHLNEALEGNVCAVVGYAILKGERELDTYKDMLARVWQSAQPDMVSIGLITDPFIETDYEFHFLIFRGSDLNHPNVITVLDEYVRVEEIDSDMKYCARAKFKGEDRCTYHYEKFHDDNLTWHKEIKGYICTGCSQTI